MILNNQPTVPDSEISIARLQKLTPSEISLLAAIISTMQRSHGHAVRLPFDMLRGLSTRQPVSDRQFVDLLETVFDRFSNLRVVRHSDQGFRRKRMTLFTFFDINGGAAQPYVDIQLYAKAIPLLDQLAAELQEMAARPKQLTSRYAQLAFKLFDQSRSAGHVEFSKDEFFALLDIPASYQRKMSNVDQYVLKPIKAELASLFPRFRVRVRHSKDRGRPVVGYVFSWMPDKTHDATPTAASLPDIETLPTIEPTNVVPLDDRSTPPEPPADDNQSSWQLPDDLTLSAVNPSSAKRRALSFSERRKDLIGKRAVVAAEITKLKAKKQDTGLSVRDQQAFTELMKQYEKLRSLTDNLQHPR